MPRTLHIAFAENKMPENPHTQLTWTPWLNCGQDKDEVTKGLALHRHLRERGGIEVGGSLRLFLCVRTTMNLPCEIKTTEMVLHHDADHARRKGADYINVLRK